MKIEINKVKQTTTFEEIEIGEVFKAANGLYYLKSFDNFAINLYKKTKLRFPNKEEVKRVNSKLIVDD